MPCYLGAAEPQCSGQRRLEASSQLNTCPPHLGAGAARAARASIAALAVAQKGGNGREQIRACESRLQTVYEQATSSWKTSTSCCSCSLVQPQAWQGAAAAGLRAATYSSQVGLGTHWSWYWFLHHFSELQSFLPAQHCKKGVRWQGDAISKRRSAEHSAATWRAWPEVTFHALSASQFPYLAAAGGVAVLLVAGGGLGLALRARGGKGWHGPGRAWGPQGEGGRRRQGTTKEPTLPICMQVPSTRMHIHSLAAWCLPGPRGCCGTTPAAAEDSMGGGLRSGSSSDCMHSRFPHQLRDSQTCSSLCCCACEQGMPAAAHSANPRFLSTQTSSVQSSLAVQHLQRDCAAARGHGDG